jgi:hypothetical protein
MPVEISGTSVATVSFATPQEVVISQADDSIAVYGNDGSSNKILKTNSAGQLEVVVTSESTGLTKNTVSQFNEISSIVSGSEITITTYTVPASKTSYLVRVTGGGENIARYRAFLNGAPIARQYTYFGGELNTEIDFQIDDGEAPGLKLVSGDTISVKVLHDRPSAADFNARIQVLEIG